MLHYACAISTNCYDMVGFDFDSSSAILDAVTATTDVFITTVYREGFRPPEFVFFYFDVTGLGGTSVLEYHDLRSRICCYVPGTFPVNALSSVWKRVAKVRPVLV